MLEARERFELCKGYEYEECISNYFFEERGGGVEERSR